ncbi:Abi family protein [Paenarthrobacter sp. PH39-S1]|uniref:Abi family protein n=1 Tax=Paenarthrobacter sp. PH39-S1 TaxID=3046204 RepID=UPI0024BA6BA4|nr:Abi family protein [Paenarthrobacter sp. PH39-S1]MDJ0355657.1 Abi family protein [Paenarthrobacter sp. PH39-S1]
MEEQVDLLSSRGLVIDSEDRCVEFLRANTYYRFSGYARYFQRAPHLGDNAFEEGMTFDEIRAMCDNDEALRGPLTEALARAEVLIRTHFACVVADVHGPYGRFLEEDSYTDVGSEEPTVEACLRDIGRSKDRHILRYRTTSGGTQDFGELPVWSAVEAWSFLARSRRPLSAGLPVLWLMESPRVSV